MAPIEFRLLPDSATVGADGSLQVGGCSLLDLAKRFGTPLFVYDTDHMRSRCREAVAAFGRGNVTYAAKAFLCRAMARLAHDEGLLLDVASGGELHVALSAGVPASSCVLHGNNKSVDELDTALTSGVHRIVVDSFDELARLERLHRSGMPAPQVLLRITPGVEAHTHEYVATGHNDSKFGFNLANGDADRAARLASDSSAVDVVGFHCHIGSNVFVADSFTKATAVMAEFASQYELPELVVGGGLGVASVAGEAAPTFTEWADAVRVACDTAGFSGNVSVEPGRSIVAAAAITLYTVGTLKRIPGVRTYLAVDGGMSDNPRPVLYGSGYEAFLPRTPLADRPKRARVVGKHCESGDILLFEASLPSDVAVDDVLAVPVTGAYGHSMGSNYNKVPRPPVLFVADGGARVVVRRETYDDLLLTDSG